MYCSIALSVWLLLPGPAAGPAPLLPPAAPACCVKRAATAAAAAAALAAAACRPAPVDVADPPAAGAAAVGGAADEALSSHLWMKDTTPHARVRENFYPNVPISTPMCESCMLPLTHTQVHMGWLLYWRLDCILHAASCW